MPYLRARLVRHGRTTVASATYTGGVGPWNVVGIALASVSGGAMLGAVLGFQLAKATLDTWPVDEETEGPDVGDISEGLHPNHVDEAELIARPWRRHPPHPGGQA